MTAKMMLVVDVAADAVAVGNHSSVYFSEAYFTIDDGLLRIYLDNDDEYVAAFAPGHWRSAIQRDTGATK